MPYIPQDRVTDATLSRQWQAGERSPVNMLYVVTGLWRGSHGL